MSLRRVVRGVLVLCMSAWLTVSAVASEYHGQVIFSGMPLPGSTVTVTATQGDKKAVAVSDEQGVFAFPDLADGTWTLTIEMTGFAPLKQQVTIAPAEAAATFELKLLSLDQIRADAKPMTVGPTQHVSAFVTAPSPAGAVGNDAAAGSTPAGAPAAPTTAAAKPASGGILINGSQSNAATSQYSMNQAFGNSRNRRSLYNGGLSLLLQNSALNAAPYSLTGTPAVKPQYNNYTFRFDFGGPLNIKRLMPRGPFFGLFYTHTQNNNYSTQAGLVPTGEQPSGDWLLNASQVFVPTDLATVAPACNSYLLSNPAAAPIDPATGRHAFVGNVIPKACVASSSTTLLGLYPAANAVNSSGYNYQIPLNSSSTADTVGLRLNKGIGKNYFNGSWNFSDTRDTYPNLFGFVDNGSTLGINTNVNWSRSLNQRIRSTLSYTFSRQRSQLLPFFAANKNDIQGTAGITGASTDPAYWGPPRLGFSSGITGLSDGIFYYNRNQTNTVKEELTWNHMRHNVTFGGTFNRLEFNYNTQTNPVGSLNFTGAGTQATSAAGTNVGGSDLADFLLGLPDTSSIAYGNANKYLRQNTYALYADDDFRVNSELSIRAGLRWEYGSPASELKGNLVNLNVGPNFSTAVPVIGSNPLLQADYGRPEPSIGIAWRPISGSSLVIRSGYGIQNDTSVYQQAAYAMAQQAPLSTSSSLSTGCPLNLATPFAANPAQAGCTSPATGPSTGLTPTIPQSFAIDPNFRVGYVQTWNLEVDRDLPFSMQLVASYVGIKGTHGVQEFLPNTCPPVVGNAPATCNGNPHGYTYRTSNGNLERQAGSINLRRRLRNGLEAGGTYTFAKSLDNDYSLGAQGRVDNSAGIAQDWTNLRGQRGLSSTDQRHLVVAYVQYTTGMGLGGKALMTGWRGAVYKEWSIRTDFSAGSGLPETPIYAGASVIGAGVTGTIRPDLVGSPYANPAPGYFLNPAAFAIPANGYGNARRNSIEGPGTFSLNATMNRTFRLHGRYSMDAQLVAANVLNHVVYPGWNVNWTAPITPPAGSTSTTTQRSSFGAPLQPNSMRTVTVNLRMRF